jgi:hypothetical protein
MMKKSIIDAVEPLRNMLKRAGVHDYAQQEQGPENKTLLPCRILTDTGVVEGTASLYRPVTKQGDPRIWILGLGKFCAAGDQLAISVGANGELLVVVLTLSDWSVAERAMEAQLRGFAAMAGLSTVNPVLEDLLQKLRLLSSGPSLAALVEGDTAVGRTLEHALGIAMNSSTEPDFQGIELKATRQRPAARKNRSTLFAQVADWTLSPCDSSRSILDAFGYWRDETFRLYCEVGASPNSQGLFLKHDATADLIEERSTRPDLPVVARWPLKTLRQRLQEKHSETAWIEVESKRVDGVEHFRPMRVLYTSAPRADIFPLLVDAGRITLDHLIKLKGSAVTEKGPLWKLEPSGHADLFEGSQTFELL